MRILATFDFRSANFRLIFRSVSSIPTRLSSVTLYRLKQIWRWVLHAGFLLLCLRFLITATGAVYPDVWPVLVLGVGCCVLGCWMPQAALFAFTVSVPLLNGLGYVGLAGLSVPVSLVFSAMFVGWIIRQLSGKGEAQGADPEVTGLKSYLEPITHNPRPSKALLVTDVLITAVLASLVMQVVRHHDAAGFWKVCWSQPMFGFGDPFYFMTSAFIWLQGLFFFRMLIEMGKEQSAKRSEYGAWGKEPRAGSEGARDKGEEQGALNKERSAGGEAVSAWVKPAFIIWGICIAAFYLLQRVFNVPDPYDTTKWCSPFEDIHSFGSFVVTLFIFAVASWRWNAWPRMIFRGIWIIGLLVLVVLSWSRATWLAGALTLLLIGWLRLPKRWTIVSLTLLVLAVAIINLNANRESWQRNEYLMRLISLARVENLTNKSPDRFNLYHKTVGMIREHPFIGHGIGSTYLTSVRFARPGDPYADIPNFAHNFLLQMAAELGIPVAALFLALILFTLWQGYKSSGAREKFQVPSAKFQDLEMLGVTMALTAYLITQMTANALNIYVSNQFFFWFLMAALLCANPTSEVESLKSKVEV